MHVLTKAQTHPRPVRSGRASALRDAGSAAGITLLVNLLLWAGARAAGVDFVAESSGASLTIGPAPIAVMTLSPILIGGLALAAAAGRLSRGRDLLAWAGLGVGIITLPMPFTVVATTGTRAALAAMHLITGVTWWFVIRRSSDR